MSHSRLQLGAERIDEFAANQHGIVSYDQLLGCGYTRKSVQARCRARRWRRVLPRVYATFTGPLPREARYRAALLYGGPESVLSHRSAGALWHLCLHDDSLPVHVTIPYHQSAVCQPPLVVVHRTRAMPFVRMDIEPPRTTLPDTIVDMATAEPTAAQAADMLISLCSRAGVPIRIIAERLQDRHPYRYASELRRGVRMLAGGSLSLLEVRYFECVEQAHGLLPGARQVPVDVDGRTLWEDIVYEDLGTPLTVRLDGRTFHAERWIAFRDRRRDNAAELAARSRLVYGWEEVTRDPCGVATEVATVLNRNGWGSLMQPCSACS